jgi:putative tryptophan/tyrosine transport system substrate-binding protein
VRRRDFIALVGGAAAAWPLGDLSGQSPAVPVVGVLNGGAPREYTQFVEALRAALKESGLVEGRTVEVIE